MNTAGPQ